MESKFAELCALLEKARPYHTIITTQDNPGRAGTDYRKCLLDMAKLCASERKATTAYVNTKKPPKPSKKPKVVKVTFSDSADDELPDKPPKLERSVNRPLVS